jgi:hypothetical protein
MGIEAATDILTRKVQFALELLDPFTGTTVSKGVEVEARTPDGKPTGAPPVVNRSGRFVWLDMGSPPPATIIYETGRLPYGSGEIDLSTGLPADRLVNVMLKPSPAYDVPTGITAVRGWLFGSDGAVKKPISGAIVQLAWAIDKAPGWIPPAPADASRMRPGEAVTDKNGQFVVFSRFPRPGTPFSAYVGYPPPADPNFNKTLVSIDLAGALPRARLQVTRLAIRASRKTPADFRFVETLPPGRIPEGRLLTRDVQLDWNELN